MASWEDTLKEPITGAMSVSEGEKLGKPDVPQNGDQRLNNVGKLESYYEGAWIVKETWRYA